MSADTGVGESGWRCLRAQRVYETPWLCVDRETVATPSRPAGVEWVSVGRPTAAVIAPRTPDGAYLLVRQERVPVRREMWEFPAGQVEGTDDPASIVATAHRELAEEAGVVTRSPLVPLGHFFSSCGFTNECSHLFLAVDVEPAADPGMRDANEAIVEQRAFPPDALVEAVGSGMICDANTLAVYARLVAKGLFR